MPSRQRKKQTWTAADRTAAFRTFVETDSISETSRRSGVPIGTLAGWLDDPRHAPELERIRKAHAREVDADDQRLARAATAVVGKALVRIDQELPAAKGKDLAAMTRAGLAVRVELHRLGRLERGESTENVAHLVDEASAVDAELLELLGSAAVRKRLKAMARGGG